MDPVNETDRTDRASNGSTEQDDIRLSTREGYDRWSELYDEDDNPLVKLEEPIVDAMLGGVRGLDVLDLGCGTGRHAIRLARDGARVAALDFSSGMLARARRKSDRRIRYACGDLRRTLPFADASFDRVTCCLVLDHIHELDPLFGEMNRVCRRNGFVLLSNMHPAIMLAGVQARFTDPATGKKVYPASAANQISDYVNAAMSAGFAIERMSEHVVDETLIARSARAEKYRGWPLLLMMKLRPRAHDVDR